MHGATTIAAAQLGHLAGKRVNGIVRENGHLTIEFMDGTKLVISIREGMLATDVHHESDQPRMARETPTKRQLEYLLFIAKYIRRYGRAPAESDIERHFLVSAPTVNQMMHMLERRGFIARQAGVPRSTTICIDLGAFRAN
jgi:hypothetical protein